MLALRERLRRRRVDHQARLRHEAGRLAAAAAALDVQRVVLFGSAARGETGLTSDLDLLIVWDTAMDFLERTAALYRRLQPEVPVDLLVYTPEEMRALAQRPFIRAVLEEGRILYEG